MTFCSTNIKLSEFEVFEENFWNTNIQTRTAKARNMSNLQEAQKQLEEAEARYNETLKKHQEWKKNSDSLRKTLNEEKSELTEAPIDARRSETINTELITIAKNEE